MARSAELGTTTKSRKAGALGIYYAASSGWMMRKSRLGSSVSSASGAAANQIVATYDYRDEQGGLLFQVVRRHPRTFLQRRPDGKGGWAWSTKGVRMVPYCLPELFAAAAKRNGHPPRVFIVEGEKDADRLKSQWGLLATTYPLGAGKWRSDYNKYFSGFDVIILPDNDDVGRKHALKVATNLYRVAANIRILELPGLPSKGDISDWLDSDASQDDFETLVDGCPAFEPIASIPADDDETLVDSF